MAINQFQGEIDVRLDSSDRASSWKIAGRYGPARAVLRCDSLAGGAVLVDRGGVERRWKDPLEALAWMAESLGEGERWIGYLSYDLGRQFEALGPGPRDDLELPLYAFTLHAAGGGIGGQQTVGRQGESEARSNFSRSAYEAAVARAIEYIRAGDIFQVNLSQRFMASCVASPASVYQRLQADSPAKYGALLDYGNFALVSNSPELFLEVTADRKVITRPIKGTRPRRRGMEDELRDSIKDQAELNMIVDLERNDLGRVCEIGSVQVSQRRIIEAHPTVYHGVATVQGKLRGDVTFVDLLRATFPGGSVTGAPKIRAMQIIDELEPVRRGPYCGAIGYIDGNGSMEFAMAIRTMIFRHGQVYIPVGGGIVADSQPAEEYEETLVKARAMFTAVGVEWG